MKIEIVKAFSDYSVGQVMPDVPGNIGRTWIGRGLAREVAAPVNEMVPRSPVDRMMRPVETRRGRPPKVA